MWPGAAEHIAKLRIRTNNRERYLAAIVRTDLSETKAAALKPVVDYLLTTYYTLY